jgi:2-polyprenyl-6-methoxyphenol hydroxylase-like FAD-dependent oxidoreductase
MTPFAGVCVNAAMVDALELGRALVGVKEGQIATLQAAIQQYERALFPRSKKFAEKTMGNLEAHFIAGGCDHIVRRLKMYYYFMAVTGPFRRFFASFF